MHLSFLRLLYCWPPYQLKYLANTHPLQSHPPLLYNHRLRHRRYRPAIIICAVASSIKFNIPPATSIAIICEVCKCIDTNPETRSPPSIRRWYITNGRWYVLLQIIMHISHFYLLYVCTFYFTCTFIKKITYTIIYQLYWISTPPSYTHPH